MIQSIPELLAQVKARNARAENVFIHLLEKEAWASIAAFIRNRSSTADAGAVFNEACAILWMKIIETGFEFNSAEKEAQISELCAYLTGISRNLLRRRFRELNKVPGSLDDNFNNQPDPDTIEDTFGFGFQEDDAELELLRRTAWQLAYDTGEPCQSRLANRYGKKMSFPEIGGRETPPVNDKTARRRVAACVQDVLSRLNIALKKSLMQIRMEDVIMDTLGGFPSRCRELLFRFYNGVEKVTMTGIAKEFGYANEHAATVAKQECINNLNLAIGDKLLGDSNK